ncbi:glutathione peroxidase [Bdellovibrio reynosensis]|uniref:Glutathione peroxidase n=1 Tax=Bdellovibrio reynosensis TaxID=2835041 RepID=A0ABY4C4N8_9BACT|nr:glutathione peroxidase [Bdellovibrio reynosensis]UOE99930.1 glutathione peroxidase [Bdellovibrio reynosensis]
MSKNFHSFTVKSATGAEVPLEKFKDNVVLVVNVASKCGYTPQYSGLEEMYEKFKAQGFTVLAFPCNQFGAQEPGKDEEIQEFCQLNYGVKFPVMAKVDVNGSNAEPVFQYLKESAPGILGTEMIKWNFTKFLVGRDGKVLKRYAPQDEPKDMMDDVSAALKA